jgi:predicted pyridoxine 5'-phosphate oxidase superfamily flavin-nucleotide-binding protein
MPYSFLDTLSTPGVEAAQVANGARKLWEREDIDRAFDRFTDAEAAFIAERDSFYMASVSENGWPYVQHRGGPPGFLKVLDETTLALADFRGNRQYISLGNVAADPALAAALALPGYKAVAERAFVLTLHAFDWNCAQHITPRYTAPEIAAAVALLRERIAALEAENQALRAAAEEEGR